MERLELEALLEAVLFAQGEPVGADKLAAALELPEARVTAGLEALQKRYESPSSGLTLLRLGDHWQLATKNQYGPWVRKALETRRAAPLTPAALETLTVIAYNQPVSRAFIEQVRGVDSSGIVASLCEKGLIEEAGRLELPGRPIAYRTTAAFLLCFGLSSLDELPDAACLGEEPPPPEEEEEQLAFET